MVLINDTTVEKPASTLKSVQKTNWFGCRVDKLDTDQASPPIDFEREATWSDFFIWLVRTPLIQVQSASIYTTSEEKPLYIYGVKDYQWSSNKVGYTLGATYPIGAEITVANTGAASFVSAVGETFSVGCTVVGALNDEIELPESIERRLEKIRGLKDNWDSYSASRISGKAIEKTKLLLIEAGIHCGVSLLQNAFIAPCSDGGIQLEFRSESERELIVKISSNGRKAGFLLSEASGKENNGAITVQDNWDAVLDALCNKRKSLR